ncbi:HlyD family type I secretion periplasmic adaptor subunit [Bosea beijingensis]|uniref:HlyD family type I secretion periplasmic adaptor subunit n=1 Tax=Bosea beijingensis TaxID=3068632 RepID=UPI0027429921|nr:HlyD family type I secretion periplasmic adaptor subunit [Bosea sp. REN20]
MTELLELQANRRGTYMTTAGPVRLGLATLAGFALVFGAWSALAPLSGAAIAQGNLQVEGQRQSVQHPDGGVIRQLRVKEGDRVARGQVLMVLSETEPKARLDILQAERDALLAEEARLVAERDRKTQPDFGALDARRDEAAVKQAIANETAILAARERQTRTQADILRQRIGQLSEQRGGLQAQIAGLERQKSLLEEEAGGARQLLAAGYTPKTRVLALERDAAKLEADRGARIAEVARIQEAVGEAELEIAKIERGIIAEVTDRLREVQAKLVAGEPRIAAASEALGRTEIKAPASGMVVGLNVFTEGGVIQPGAKLMDVVPNTNPLMVEARLPLNEISDVATGRQADIRLVSINRNERPTIRGEIVVVSADRITDERSGQAFYSVKVRMNDQDVQRAKVALQSGMVAEVVIPTKGRSLFEYLVGPLLDEISGSFREK